MRWTGNCVISEVSRTFRVVPNADPVVYEVATQITSATIQINNAKFYVAVVTLSINDNIKFLHNIKQGFKRTISWNKYRSEITRQPKNNNLDDQLIQHLEILIDCLYFHSKTVIIILKEIHLMSITCH